MPQTVTLALVGDPAQPGERIDPQEWEKPWDERPQIQLEVEETETLASIVERGVVALEVAFNLNGLQPVHAVDLTLFVDDTVVRPHGTVFTLVDDDGKAVWNVHDLAMIPYGQLVRSAEAGAVVGDPQRLYLILREPIGNGLGLDWETAFLAWLIFWRAVESVAAAGGAVQAVRGVFNAVRDRLGLGRETLHRNAHRWAQRGALPPEFARFLDRDTWSSATLSSLLSCSVEDAEAILALFGFTYDEHDELWQREGDVPARLLRSAYRDAEIRGRDLALSEEARMDFEQRLEEMLRTGEPLAEPTLEGDDLEDIPEYFQFLSLTIAPEGLAGVGQLGERQVQIQVPAEQLRGEIRGLFNDLVPVAWRVLASEVARLGTDVDQMLDEPRRLAEED